MPRGDAVVYGTAVLTGAALVFQIQPIAGKLLLPLFGGGASVWTTCMFFFQSMLLAGYAYAHLLTTALRPRHQVLAHCALLTLSLLTLPVSFASAQPAASGDNPGGLILLSLLLAIGFPFVMLASTAPLIQRWSSMTHPTRSPYRLYALSNAGALLALLTYPLMIEPNVNLTVQTGLWSAAYGAFVILSLAAASQVWLRSDRMAGASAVGTAGAPTESVDRQKQYPVVNAVLTVVLSAAGVVILLAVTNQITQNVAPIPFLWILPLVGYLLTYIACFSGEGWYDRAIWGSFFVVAASSAIILHFFATSFAIVPVIVSYLLVLLCTCTVCHAELYRLRPAPQRLTAYYMLIALGGALGGALVSIVAPLVFERYWEDLAAIYVIYLVFGIVVLRGSNGSQRAERVHARSALQAQIVRWSERLFLLGWSVGILLFPAVIFSLDAMRVDYNVVNSRNFYGLMNVRDVVSNGPPRRILVDGTTIHGFQLLDEARKEVPTSYYARNTGIALVMENIERPAAGLRAGIVGLGTGTLAAYGEESDEFRFYELNPAVIDVAWEHFSFLQDSAATIDIVPGDGRISMERELQQSGSRGYDILVIDAFNSDAIPVHLLTIEALQIYWKHLQPDGVLALHITNNYLDLAPVVANLGSRLGKEALLITTVEEGDTSLNADWALLTQNPAFLAKVQANSRLPAHVTRSHPARVWTDDYSDVLSILRRRP